MELGHSDHERERHSEFRSHGQSSHGSCNCTTYYGPAAKNGFDPEGLLTTLGCFYIGCVGLFCGRLFVTKQIEMEQTVVGRTRAAIGSSTGDESSAREDSSLFRWQQLHRPALLAWGVVALANCFLGMVVFGLLFGIPYNKRMWSLSYGFAMAGFAGFFLCAVYLWHDVWLPRTTARAFRWADLLTLMPFMYLGTNATLFFVFSDAGGMTCKILNSVYFGGGDRRAQHTLIYWYKKVQEALMSVLRRYSSFVVTLIRKWNIRLSGLSSGPDLLSVAQQAPAFRRVRST